MGRADGNWPGADVSWRRRGLVQTAVKVGVSTVLPRVRSGGVSSGVGRADSEFRRGSTMTDVVRG